ncbi:hypothetical protein SmJEL517_g03056 [Synchytrium microbalum]|uniref:Uncharacterized protein n=1 Tax=Synchytrium microbalum TaxID=1806994 RepID=A0A507C3Z3_9FUNG|nr:uncharacterized protein SmJEL517_g03056 [Synchytrium microbalum]TPX34191.1 hypothetical protein SmJEL517_g03056 [Synchytrium microbalum]
MSVTFGGDEVSAIVMDFGSSITKAGYAGEDTPRAVFPSWLGVPPGSDTVDNNIKGKQPILPTDDAMDVDLRPNTQHPVKKRKKRFVGENQAYLWQPAVEMKNPFVDGVLQDFDLLESLWDHAMYGSLRVNTTEHPLLLSEAPFNVQKTREKLTELAFEKYGVPAFYLEKSPILSAFAFGRGSALVVESGAGSTCVTPVSEGHILRKGLKRQPIAGDFLTRQAELYLRHAGVVVEPQYLVYQKQPVDANAAPIYTRRDRAGTTQSWHRQATLRAVNDFKETVCIAWDKEPYNEPYALTKGAKSYEFPTGFNRSFGIERTKIMETLFDPAYALKEYETDPNVQYVGIGNLIKQSIDTIDPDIRPMMVSNIILTGGNTLIPGLLDRLQTMLSRMPGNGKVRVSASSQPVERKFGAWIGGSILSSLGTFHQLWVAKREYEENGVNVCEKYLH